MKRRLDFEWQRNSTIEGKASTIIQVSGTITTLIFGFVTFVQATTNFTLPTQVAVIIVISIVFSILSIIISINVLWIREYSLPVNITKFRKPNFTKMQIDQFAEKPFGHFLDMQKIKESIEGTSKIKIILNYIAIINLLSHQNQQKGYAMLLATVFLVMCIGLTGFAVVFIFWSSSAFETSNNQMFCVNPSNFNFTINPNTITEKNSNSEIILCFDNSQNE